MPKTTDKPPPADDAGADEVWGDFFWSFAGKPPGGGPAAEAPPEAAAEAKPPGKPKKPGRQRRAR